MGNGLPLPRRSLGRTGLQVSALGVAALSVPAWGRRGPALTPDDVERAFHELGVNTFLAHYLMPGICQGVRRLVESGHRHDLVLVSEVGLPFAGSVRRGLDKHLRLLGTDHLDVWLFGWVRAPWDLRPVVWNEMRRLREAGEVRAIGFSSHNRPLASSLAGSLDPDVLMIRYNAAHRGAEREVFRELPRDLDSRPGVIAYTVTRWGMLLKPLPDRGFHEGMAAPECSRFALGHPAVDLAW